jgi:hypothetical protein
MVDDTIDTAVDETEDLSIADIAGIDISEIAEKRFVQMPVGVYHWIVKEAGLDMMEISGTQKKVPAIVVECQVKNIQALAKGAVVVPEEIIGETRKEIFRYNPEKQTDWIGYFKAFAADTGYTASGSLQEVLAGYQGHEFIAPIVHRRNKDDADRPYVNIDRTKMMPVSAA